MVTGTWPADGGAIVFDGQDITGLPAHHRFALGLLRTFQIPHEFARMSALENLMVFRQIRQVRILARRGSGAGGCGGRRSGSGRGRRRSSTFSASHT